MKNVYVFKILLSNLDVFHGGICTRCLLNNFEIPCCFFSFEIKVNILYVYYCTCNRSWIHFKPIRFSIIVVHVIMLPKRVFNHYNTRIHTFYTRMRRFRRDSSDLKKIMGNIFCLHNTWYKTNILVVVIVGGGGAAATVASILWVLSAE